jgi:hypothetical protein
VIRTILVVVFLSASVRADKPARDDARVRAWQGDLDVLARVIREKHKNPFTKITKVQFDEAVARVREKIPGLEAHQILIEFLKLTALLGDGHTTVGPGKDGRRFRSLPIGLIWTRDGLYVAATTPEFKDLLRRRVVGIGPSSLDTAIPLVAGLSAAENESGRRDAVRRWMTRPEALHALGLIEDMESVPIALVNSSETKQIVRLAPLPATGQPNLVFAVDPKRKDLPVSLRASRDRYGFEWLADSKTLYCWYDSCANVPDRPVSGWCKEVLAQIDSRSVERVVIDLRRNGGGNSALAQPLISGLRKRMPINQKGKLFVLIGPGTYSSAMQNALELRQRTQAILIGLPTGGSPNAFGEIKFVEMPHSKWMVQYSTKYFQGTRDGATTVAPDVEVEPTAGEYFSAHDPVLTTALRYLP